MSLIDDIEQERYDDVIVQMRQWAQDDPSACFSDHAAKQWLGLRWKDLFLQEAVTDKAAVKEAGHAPGIGRVFSPHIHDGRTDRHKISDRFLKGISARDWDRDMPEPQHDEITEATMVLCPGLLTGLLHPAAHAFLDEAPALEEERGWRTLRSDLHPMRGCEANEADIVATLSQGVGFTAANEEITDPKPPGKVWLVGYSKGGPDVLSFLVHHPEFKDQIAGVFTWAGAMSGSYSADTIYEQIKDVDTQTITDNLDRFLGLLNPGMVQTVTGMRRVDEYDVKQAFWDLRTSTREDFNKEHAQSVNDLGIPIFSLSGSTTPWEVPNFQFADTIKMMQFDSNNDMQLTQEQARMDIPISTHVSMLHGTHWDIAYAPFPRQLRALSPNLTHPFPRKSALAASWHLLAELGLID